MKPKFWPIVLLLLLPFALNAQNRKADFHEIFAKGDMDATLKYITTWQKAEPQNPEVYVAFANVYANEGLKEVLALTTKKPEGDAYALKNKKNKTVGYISGTTGFNEAYLEKAFNYLDTGIAKFPNRLDIHFGKVYLLGRVKNYDAFTAELVKTIEYGHTINYKWLWTNSEAKPDGEGFMLGTVQSYQEQLFNGDENADHIRMIAEAVLKYHPDNVENLSDLSVSYMIKKDFTSALPPLLKAEKLAPQDTIVLNNIAYCYSQMKDKPNAVKYYNMVLKVGDDNAKKNATERLKALEKE